MNAQDAVHNFGNLQFHGTVEVGFHIDLIDDGTFDQNLGLAGIYGEDTRSISGTSTPVFNDFEVMVENGLFLTTNVGVTSNANFILGNVFTDKDNGSPALIFRDAAFYVGQGSNTKIDGFGAAVNKASFTFPVGDDNRLRPLSISAETVNEEQVRCAYFFEDANSPVSIPQQFNTQLTEDPSVLVSDFEFWILEGSQPVAVTLTWDPQSNIPLLTENLQGLKVVGWSKTDGEWKNLGVTNITGESGFGALTSDTFIPDDYAVLTIGGNNNLFEETTTIEFFNYYVSPNNDGINDTLVIENIENFPNNSFSIYNRYGVLVYKEDNYTNGFIGKSNRGASANSPQGLSGGVYYYILDVPELMLKHQGHLYLSQ